jgi:hypothetical protein
VHLLVAVGDEDSNLLVHGFTNLMRHTYFFVQNRRIKSYARAGSRFVLVCGVTILDKDLDYISRFKSDAENKLLAGVLAKAKPFVDFIKLRPRLAASQLLKHGDRVNGFKA